MNSIPFLRSLRRDQTVLVLSAHCDDAELGCGGLLKRLVQDGEYHEIRHVVFSGGNNPIREEEERNASLAFGIRHATFHSYPDSLLPNYWHEIKKDLLMLRDEIGIGHIGIVLCPRLDDRHQDHRVVTENVWRVFRDHLILEYEIHSYEGDLGQPNIYVELTEAQANEKADLLVKCYPSRACHRWWNRENFLALMRLRGVEANVAYAEGLIARKMLV